MHSARDNEGSVLFAPERLVAETRSDFRDVALMHLDRLEAGAPALIIDMQHTMELDASGLGILVLVQKRAKERGLPTRLRQTPAPVRNLLKLTMLDFLFELRD